MADELLRAAERAARAGGPADEARHLVARLRAGDLTRERLELAAYAGHEAARACLVAGPPDKRTASGAPTACTACLAQGVWANYTFDTPGGWHCLRHATEHPDLALWLAGLSRWDGALVRAAVAAGWVALMAWRPCPGGGRDFFALDSLCECGYGFDAHRNPDKNPRLARARRALEAAEAWIACPCKEHQSAWELRRLDVGVDMAMRWVPWFVAAGAHPEYARASIADAARLAGDAPVRAAIQAALIRWALA